MQNKDNVMTVRMSQIIIADADTKKKKFDEYMKMNKEK